MPGLRRAGCWGAGTAPMAMSAKSRLPDFHALLGEGPESALSNLGGEAQAGPGCSCLTATLSTLSPTVHQRYLGPNCPYLTTTAMNRRSMKKGRALRHAPVFSDRSEQLTSCRPCRPCHPCRACRRRCRLSTDDRQPWLLW